MPFTPAITTPDVKAISSLQSDDLSAHITNAQTYMDDVFADVTISDDLYRLVGLYVVAHLAFLQEGQVKMDKVDVLSTTYNMTSDLALNSTTFGQMAISLDSTGTLAKLNALAKSDDIKRTTRIDIC